MQIQLNPDQNYTLILTGNEIVIIQNALMEIPAKFANPLVQKLAYQVQPTPEPEDK